MGTGILIDTDANGPSNTNVDGADFCSAKIPVWQQFEDFTYVGNSKMCTLHCTFEFKNRYESWS